MNNCKINILMIIGNTERGGAQAYVLNVLRSIDRSIFQIDIAVNESVPDGYDDEIKALGSNIYFFPKFKFVNFWEFRNIWEEICKGHKYNIIEAHATNAASVIFRIARKYGIHTIAHSHSAGYRGNIIEKCIKKAFSKFTKYESDYWFACSDLAAERLFGKKYRSYPRYYDIPNAIDTTQFLYDEDKHYRIRQALGIDRNTIVIGHVGSFTEPKNHTFLIDIFYELKKEKRNYVLLLIGDGPLKETIEEKTKKLGLSTEVFFIGNVQNVNDYMMAMDILLFPSVFEGFPVALVEAQTTGLPCVISDSITKDVNQTELIHRLSLNLSAKEWAQKIMDSISMTTDRKKYFEILNKSQFDIRKNTAFLMELYINIVND